MCGSTVTHPSEGPPPLEALPALPAARSEALVGIILMAARHAGRAVSPMEKQAAGSVTAQSAPQFQAHEIEHPVVRRRAGVPGRCAGRGGQSSDSSHSTPHGRRGSRSPPCTSAAPVNSRWRAPLATHSPGTNCWRWWNATKLDARLLEVFINTKLSLEEGGSNTLFLAFGFSEMDRSRAAGSFAPGTASVGAGDDAAQIGSERLHTPHGMMTMTIVNPTLLQLLREEFHLNLPGLDPLRKMSTGVVFRTHLQISARSLQNYRWEVIEQVYLGTSLSQST